MESIDRREVKAGFILANTCKNMFVGNPADNLLREGYGLAAKYVQKMSDDLLNANIRDKVRLGRYEAMTWSKGTVKLENLGPWPKMQGLDIRLTTGNILETADEVANVKKGKIKLKVPEKLLRKLDSLSKNIDFIHDRLPLIVFPGGTVRENDYNNWAREEGHLLCGIFEGDIDDGNSRALAYALAGIRQAPAYVGTIRNETRNVPKYDKKDMH